MKGYRFTILYNGFGNNEEEAWLNAMEQFALFPPDLPRFEHILEICPDCGFPFKQCICEATDEDSDPDQWGSDAWLDKADREYEEKRDKEIDNFLS